MGVGTWGSEVRRLARLWRVSLVGVDVVFSARFKTATGSADFKRKRVAISAAVPERLRAEVLCHELAHLAAFRLVGRAESHHGPTWQRLVRKAGFTPRTRVAQPVARKRIAATYLHACPVCDFSRRARRTMTTWRCADCVRAGLDGHLTITRISP